jgi:hypothetical protein
MFTKLRLTVLVVFVAQLELYAQTSRPTTIPTGPIQYEQREIIYDGPVKLHIAWIDLSDSRVSVHVVPGGPDPDDKGRYEVTMGLQTKLALEHNFALSVNAAFADVKGARNGKNDQPVYLEGMWADATGYFVANGKVISADAWKQAASLYFTREHRPKIGRFIAIPADAHNMVTGSHLLVWNGRLLPIQDQATHPRTLAGIGADGRLILVVADGRRPGYSVGLRLADAAKLMLDLGCDSALNLDGGGSSAMVLRDKEGPPKIVNVPSDGSSLPLPLSIERPVAFALGFRVANADHGAILIRGK